MAEAAAGMAGAAIGLVRVLEEGDRPLWELNAGDAVERFDSIAALLAGLRRHTHLS